jgi:hypothetical protein
LASDAIDYTEGDVLNSQAGGIGWTDAWFAESNVTIQGGAASIAGADFPHLMSRPFAPTSDTLYVGMQLRTDMWDNDFMQLQVSNGATGNGANTMTVGLDGRNAIGFYSRIGTSGQGSSFSTGATFADATDYLLVGKFSKDGGSATYNRVDFFVDPVGLTEPAMADATRDGIDSTLNELSLFTVRTALMEGTETILIDDLRVATSFAAAVPEPSSLLLAAVAVTGLLGRCRRRQCRVV